MLPLVEEPEYTEEAFGGCTVGSVSCLLKDADRDRIADAPVLILPRLGAPWMGRVADVQHHGKVSRLSLTGVWADLARQRRDVLYCDTSLDVYSTNHFEEHVGHHPNIGFEISAASCRFLFGRGNQYTTGMIGRANRVHKPVTSLRLRFSYTVPTGYVFRIYSRDGASVTQQGSDYTGSGTVDLYITGTAIDAHLLYTRATATVTPTTDDVVRIYNLRAYYEGISTINATSIITNVCANLPGWVLPSGTQYRWWVASDTQEIEPFTLPSPDTTPRDILEEVLQYRDYDFRFSPRLVDGRWRAVPWYGPRDSTPKFQVYPGFGSTHDLTGSDITAMSSAVRVLYRDPDGRSRYLEVVDTSLDSYLSNIGQAKVDTVAVDTASTATATLIGQRFLAQRRPSLEVGARVSGNLNLAGAIQTIGGAEASPLEVLAGDYVRVHATAYGSVDVRVEEITKRGPTASASVNNLAFGLDAELALLRKRAS